MKYLKLLRLQDQYLQVGFAIASGIYLRLQNSTVFIWILASTLISITAFIANELTDKNDVDKYSWNNIHIKDGDQLSCWIVSIIFITFSLIGLFLSSSIGLLNWGLLMYVTGLMYSLKPIRLKARPVWDILAQLMVWLFIPFMAPVILHNQLINALPLAITLSLLCWSICFPYQIADLPADQKAGLKCTHVVLGINNSLVFGLLIGITGIIIYVKYNIFHIAPWSMILIPLTLLVVFLYFYWYMMKPPKKQLYSMQLYVRKVKPLTQLLVPYLLIWYLLI